MKLLSILLRYSRGTLVLATLAGIAAGGASAGLLILINTLLHREDPAAGNLLGLFIALTVLVPVTSIAATYLLVRLGQQAIVGLRLDLCRQILRTPLSHLEELGTHRLLASLTDDVASITQAVALIPLLCMNGALLVGCMAYLGWLSWPLLLVLLALIVVGAVSYQLPMMLGARRMQQFREAADILFGHFRALTGGIKELKLHGTRHTAFLSELESSSLRLRDLGVSGITLFSAAASWGQFLLFLIIGGLLFGGSSFELGSREVINGFILTVLFLIGPLQGILSQVPQIGRAGVALQKIERLGLSLQQGQDPEAVPVPPAAVWESLELYGVTHVYRRDDQGGEFILGPIHLTLRPGELVFITGGNGSGKTTLAKVLTGLYPSQAGEVRIDGRSVDEAGRHAQREMFSAVFSDFFLFDQLVGRAVRTSIPVPWSISGACSLTARCRCSGEGSLPPICLRDNASALRSWLPIWRTGRSTSSMNGRPTRTPTSRRSSTASSYPSSRRAAAAFV